MQRGTTACQLSHVQNRLDHKGAVGRCSCCTSSKVCSTTAGRQAVN